MELRAEHSVALTLRQHASRDLTFFVRNLLVEYEIVRVETYMSDSVGLAYRVQGTSNLGVAYVSEISDTDPPCSGGCRSPVFMLYSRRSDYLSCAGIFSPFSAASIRYLMATFIVDTCTLPICSDTGWTVQSNCMHNVSALHGSRPTASTGCSTSRFNKQCNEQQGKRYRQALFYYFCAL